MPQKSRPDPANGTVITADEYEGISLGSFVDGIIGAPADTAVVYADSTGRQVKVRAGKLANIRGYSWQSDPSTDEIINNSGAGLPANTSGNPRIDRLVLRLDRAARTIRTVYLQGAAAVTPAAPALTQNTSLTSGLWDFPLARWNVANGYTTVAAVDIVTEAWYRAPGGSGTPLCTSTARPFGAYLYPGLSVYETDTKLFRTWDTVAWQTDPRTVGGIRWTGGGNLVTGLNTTEIQFTTSGSITLPPNSTLSIKAKIKLLGTVTGDVFVIRIRDTNVSGTPRGDITWKNPDSNFSYTEEIEGFYETGAAETKTFVLTGQRVFGTGNLTVTAGGTTQNIYFKAIVEGPSGVLTVSATP